MRFQQLSSFSDIETAYFDGVDKGPLSMAEMKHR